MNKLISFISEHQNDDVDRLLLNKNKWPDIDIDIAVATIEARKKAQKKIPTWAENPAIIYSNRLSIEQCSSEPAATYKASIVKRLAPGGRVADLTAGLGVDSWAFSKVAGKVLYNEMQPILAKAAEHNFRALGADNIEISSEELTENSIGDILNDFRADIIYLDPARRSSSGKKVFLLEDCSPDILKLKETLLEAAPYILIKLSPMADITMAVKRLGEKVREVHIIAVGGECKELLILMDRNFRGKVSTTIIEDGHDLVIGGEAEARARFVDIKSGDSLVGKILFEPGKALAKSGAFNLISERFSLAKLDQSTHLYIGDSVPSEFGKLFRILEVEPLSNKSVKEFSKRYPKAEVSAKNIPVTSENLRKKLGVSPSDRIHIFGVRMASANFLIATERLSDI